MNAAVETVEHPQRGKIDGAADRSTNVRRETRPASDMACRGGGGGYRHPGGAVSGGGGVRGGVIVGDVGAVAELTCQADCDQDKLETPCRRKATVAFLLCGCATGCTERFRRGR